MQAQIIAQPRRTAALGAKIDDSAQEMLPKDIVAAAAEQARQDRLEGRLIPNEKMYALVAERLGWK